MFYVQQKEYQLIFDDRIIWALAGVQTKMIKVDLILSSEYLSRSFGVMTALTG